jgi:SAM-dependent methyltransferase
MSGRYVGSELELFSAAANWKTYFSRALAPFLGARVLEVGAGIGSNIPYLRTPAVREWTSLEPDPELARRIAERIDARELPDFCTVIAGTLESVDAARRFDSILYLDVLEHIADDAEELAHASRLLAPGGNLVVLAPAHQYLFSPFDAAIGHFRRYSAASLIAAGPPSCRLRSRFMLDCAGLLASLANRLLLRQATPTGGQIAFWDRILVPISRLLDRATGHRLGKTVVAVWTRGS